MLDDCIEKYRRGSAKQQCCMTKLAWLCVVEDLPLYIGTQPRFAKFMRWEPRWSSISKQSATRSIECQSEELKKRIEMEMKEVAKEKDIAFKTNFWMSPVDKSFITMNMHWIIWD